MNTIEDPEPLPFPSLPSAILYEGKTEFYKSIRAKEQARQDNILEKIANRPTYLHPFKAKEVADIGKLITRFDAVIEDSQNVDKLLVKAAIKVALTQVVAFPEQQIIPVSLPESVNPVVVQAEIA